MAGVAVVKKGVFNDIFDVATSYFTQAKPREFFKFLHQLCFWNKYVTGKESAAIKASLLGLPKVFDAFNALDFMGNLNALRNHLMGKDVKDISIITADTVGSGCDTVCWSSCFGIVALSSNILKWTMVGSGAAMMYSFTRHTVKAVDDLINKPLDKEGRKIKMWDIAKNVSLFAIGALTFISGWFAIPLMITALSVCGAVAVASNFAIHYIQNINKPYVSFSG